MKALEFNFLSSVSLVESNQDSILIKLSTTVNQELCFITAECEVSTDDDMIKSVSNDTILTVLDFYNIHMIKGLPFKLTPQQVIDLNNVLYDELEEV